MTTPTQKEIENLNLELDTIVVEKCMDALYAETATPVQDWLVLTGRKIELETFLYGEPDQLAALAIGSVSAQAIQKNLIALEAIETYVNKGRDITKKWLAGE